MLKIYIYIKFTAKQICKSLENMCRINENFKS